MPMLDVPVAALNALTSRWCAAIPDADIALSAVGAWPLLAILADSADGEARAELAAAVGVDPNSATAAVRALDGLLASMEGVTTAFGLWTSGRIAVRPDWVSTLPPGTHTSLTGDPAADQAAADAWVAERTNGRLTRMPVTIDKETMLLLAGTITLDGTWRHPFYPPWPDTAGIGAWHGRAYTPMSRRTDGMNIVRARPDLTLVRVEGADGIDVELALGLPAASASEVLTAAIARIGQAAPRMPKGRTPPGVTFETDLSHGRRPSCRIVVPPFTIRTTHDLLSDPDVLGLRTVSDRTRGHLPRVSTTPLAVGQARQDITVSFGQWGFKAEVVTGFEILIGGPPPSNDVRTVCVTFDRPFGFLAVHRETGLVLAAGWVAEPTNLASVGELD
jgi:serine protease inhibitor